MIRKSVASYGLAALSILLILGGAVALGSAYFPRLNRLPVGPIVLWAGPSPKLNLVDTNVTIILYRDNQQFIVDFTIGPQYSMVCHFDLLLPFRISIAQSYSLFNDSLSSPYAIPFAVVPLEHDSTWVSLNGSLPTLTGGKITLILRSDPVISAIEEPGKLTAVLTFGGPLVSATGWMALADRMRAIGSEVVFAQVRTLPLFVVYSSDSVLSSDTYPPPLQLFSTPSINGAKWILNFTNPLPAFGQSIIVSVSEPSAAIRRDLLFFVAGLLTATGATGLFDVLRDYLKTLNREE
jgi:hypothetical protein